MSTLGLAFSGLGVSRADAADTLHAGARASARLKAALLACAAFWLIAIGTRYVYSSLPPTDPLTIRKQAAVVFFFASLGCCFVAAPWIIHPPRRGVAVRDSEPSSIWGAARVVLAAALCLCLLWALLPTGVGAMVKQVAAAPGLLIPGLVLSALAEEAFFRQALPSAVLEYSRHRFHFRSIVPLASVSLAVSQGLCAAGHLSPSAQWISGGSGLWHVIAWIVGTNFVFGSLMLINWWSGAGLAERVAIHSCANLAVVLVPTGIVVGIWRSSMFCAVGLMLSLAAFTWKAVQNIVRYRGASPGAGGVVQPSAQAPAATAS